MNIVISVDDGQVTNVVTDLQASVTILDSDIDGMESDQIFDVLGSNVLVHDATESTVDPYHVNYSLIATNRTNLKRSADYMQLMIDDEVARYCEENDISLTDYQLRKAIDGIINSVTESLSESVNESISSATELEEEEK